MTSLNLFLPSRQFRRGARAIYPASTYARLQAVKSRYDPVNLFRGDLDITPAKA